MVLYHRNFIPSKIRTRNSKHWKPEKRIFELMRIEHSNNRNSDIEIQDIETHSFDFRNFREKTNLGKPWTCLESGGTRLGRAKCGGACRLVLGEPIVRPPQRRLQTRSKNPIKLRLVKGKQQFLPSIYVYLHMYVGEFINIQIHEQVSIPM